MARYSSECILMYQCILDDFVSYQFQAHAVTSDWKDMDNLFLLPSQPYRLYQAGRLTIPNTAQRQNMYSFEF